MTHLTGSRAHVYMSRMVGNEENNPICYRISLPKNMPDREEVIFFIILKISKLESLPTLPLSKDLLIRFPNYQDLAFGKVVLIVSRQLD